MLKVIRRVVVLKRHLQKQPRICSNTSVQRTETPNITVTPSLAMVDEQVKIHLNGLEPRQKVTLVASLVENESKFTSWCVYQADDIGEIDNFSSASLDGTFKGVDPMGLFWSMQCPTPKGHSTRLVKKDVSSPMEFVISVYADAVTGDTSKILPLTEVKVQRLYKRPGVKRIPLNGRIKGTIFIPEGTGPFPGLIDMYGGLVSLIETKAALLASHGYATLALSYVYGNDLPQKIMDTDFNYIREAYQWFMEQDYVDRNRLGAVGLCYGGFLCLSLATAVPEIKAVVNVNGLPIVPRVHSLDGSSNENEWPDKKKVYNTSEGVVVIDVFNCEEPWPVQAWEHGAKILVIVGGDDKQVNPKWHDYFYDHVPQEFKHRVQIHRYPGAGHLIEPPYSPHSRAVTPGRKRMQSINFMPEQFYDEPMVAGGWPQPHAQAQVDSWRKILEFLETNVKNSR